MSRALVLAAALVATASACTGAAEPAGTTTTVPLPPVAAATTPVPVATTTIPVTTTSRPVVTVTPTKTVPRPRYVFPVAPPTNYGPDHHDYPATDIFAPVGTVVVAVTDGVVGEVSRRDVWDPAVNDPATRGGLHFSMIGDDGVRYYYSHFDELLTLAEAGDRVEAGEAIGTVGNSGNARDTPSHIHFGISRPTFPGDWEVRRGQIPPYEYLQQWADGIDVSPVLPTG